MAQYIYVLDKARKAHGDKVVLDNVTLSFLPGAKIGVVGPNGSGKSSLLRIMAGLDKDIVGEAWAAKGTRIGYLAQEPELDPTLDVRGNVEKAVADTRALLTRFEEVSARFAEVTDDDEMNALIDEQAKLQDRIDASGAWELDRKIEEMQSMRKTLSHLIHCCHGDDRPECPILEDLGRSTRPVPEAKAAPRAARASQARKTA